MRIESSAIQLSSQRSYIEKSSTQETLQAWVGQRPEEQPQSPAGEIDRDPEKLIAQLRQIQARAGLAQMAKHEASVEALAAKTEEAVEESADLLEEFNAVIMRKLMKVLFGKDFEMPKNTNLSDNADGLDVAATENAEGSNANWGAIYEYHSERFESETTTFNAKGIVRTADGREIEIAIDLRMTREFYQREDISIRMGNALQDPLVLNFDGSAAELTERKFKFDLDADGQADNMSFATPGSGFLALDKNNDGKINDGSELFGPQSGNGFAELSKYDKDGNGWIDENDSIFKQLLLWAKNNLGEDKLISLKDAGVGAISLDKIGTNFSLNNQQTNETLGKVRNSSLFLFENGLPGTIQQLDLAI